MSSRSRPCLRSRASSRLQGYSALPPCGAARAERADQRGQVPCGAWIVSGDEVVDVRKRGAHADGQRLIAERGGARVEPGEPAALQPQPLQLAHEQVRVAAIPTVG